MANKLAIKDTFELLLLYTQDIIKSGLANQVTPAQLSVSPNIPKIKASYELAHTDDVQQQSCVKDTASNAMLVINDIVFNFFNEISCAWASI